jgi:RNA polymerase sigma-70 factor (ECF subfamily)
MSQANIESTARAWALAQPLVAAFISAAVRNYADSQDVLQEVAVAVFADGGSAHPTTASAFNAWALGIARHKIADHFRRKRRHPVMMDEGLLDSVAAAFSQQPDSWTAQGQALEHCMNRVKGDAKRLLELRYQEGRTPEDIARALGRTAVAIRVSLHRVRAALRECVERRLGPLSAEGLGAGGGGGA